MGVSALSTCDPVDQYRTIQTNVFGHCASSCAVFVCPIMSIVFNFKLKITSQHLALHLAVFESKHGQLNLKPAYLVGQQFRQPSVGFESVSLHISGHQSHCSWSCIFLLLCFRSLAQTGRVEENGGGPQPGGAETETDGAASGGGATEERGGAPCPLRGPDEEAAGAGRKLL